MNSFATGWNYFLKYVINIPTNLTAAGLVISYWRPDLNVAIWITVFGIVIIVINVSLLDPGFSRF
jgi:amino acid transporter